MDAGHNDYLAKILTAQVYDVAIESPLELAPLDQAVRMRGVIAASAGNHAQGVALAAQKLGCPAVIVMPVTTPRIKIEAVQRLGTQVVLHGDAYDEAHTHAEHVAAQQHLTFVHPYDDPEVIAGQGTVGMEILRQCSPPPQAIFVPRSEERRVGKE